MALFKVIHGKHRTKRGEHILPGGTFEADPTSVKNFMDKLERVDTDPEVESVQRLAFVRLLDGTFDVVNEVTSARVNDIPLTQEDAEALLGFPIPDLEIVDPPLEEKKEIAEPGATAPPEVDGDVKPETDSVPTTEEPAKKKPTTKRRSTAKKPTTKKATTKRTTTKRSIL